MPHKANRRIRRSARKALLARARRYGDQLARALYNRIMRAEKKKEITTPEMTERAAIFNSMTNWQRNKCMRACRGNLKKLSTAELKAWAEMPHWKKTAAAAGALRNTAGIPDSACLE